MKNKNMKKLLFLSILSLTILGLTNNGAIAADDVTPVSLNVDSVIAISCSSSVTMNPIVSTGQSSLVADADNQATCNIITNDSDGYQLAWKASDTDMLSGTDFIDPYSPGTSDTPENWSVASGVSEWGARLMTTSTDDNTATWGTVDNSYSSTSANWLNVRTTDRVIVQRASETTGSDEIIQFGAEIGSAMVQPTGNYTVDVTFTATTL
ncbi:MAG: hypothetical protein WAV31_06055 [Candidatus Moraniibacteriota bacterium]